jgi:hypothetical protein
MKKLESKKMAELQGGVSRAEYCGTLCMIMNNSEISLAMVSAWSANCAPYGYAC